MMNYEPKNCEGSCKHDALPLQQKQVPDSDGQTEGETIKETLEEPLERVEAGGDALVDQVLLQPPQLLVEDPIMMVLKPDQLGKAWNEETVHAVLGTRHQLTQRPECVFFRVEIHQQ